MRQEDYENWAMRAIEWSVAYRRGVNQRPVRAQTAPGDIAALLPPAPPENAEDMETVFTDFERIVPDGMTHWQHPRFFAYFPANAAPASVVAEHLTAALAAQCMLWQTSPAATEIEARMVDWMRQAIGLPDRFSGVIQDSATTATLCAVLTMRERALGWRGNEEGLSGQPRLRIYASQQAHSSVDKAVIAAGIGREGLVKVETGAGFAIRPDALRQVIAADRAAGFLPAGIVAVTGGTKVGACDDVTALAEIARAEGLYLHVDAAWAGSAMICPEFRALWHGVEAADSIVINPHKWLGAQFDCSTQFLADPKAQIRTVGLRPSYLETPGRDAVVNYSEWTLPLGRRFRALKLWFLFRAYGLEGLRARIRNHVAWARELEAAIARLPGFEIVTPCSLSLFTFRFAPPEKDPDKATAALLETVNDDGRIYLTQTRHRGRLVIRFQVGQFDCRREDVMTALDVLRELSADTVH